MSVFKSFKIHLSMILSLCSSFTKFIDTCFLRGCKEYVHMHSEPLCHFYKIFESDLKMWHFFSVAWFLVLSKIITWKFPLHPCLRFSKSQLCSEWRQKDLFYIALHWNKVYIYYSFKSGSVSLRVRTGTEGAWGERGEKQACVCIVKVGIGADLARKISCFLKVNGCSKSIKCCNSSSYLRLF